MFKIIQFKSLSSTNQYLKDNYSIYSDKTVVVCSEQTQGRGRFGRKWEMEPLKNLAFSVLLKPTLPFDHLARISLIASGAMFQVLHPLKEGVLIKWPNDILVGKKKICGILLESILSDKVEALIIGVGLNLNATTVPSHLNHKATSLKIETNQDYDRDEILHAFLTEFQLLYEDYIQGGKRYLDICRKHSSIIGKNIKINNQDCVVLDILESGSLLVSCEGKHIEYSFGEVTIGYEN